jgi:hypothetical protein
MSPYKIVEDDFCSHNPKLDELGEPYSKLIEEGWSVVRVEKMTTSVVQKMNQERFSSPNEPSDFDRENFRVRFKYVGPRDEKNRQFCREMLSKNRVYRIEDINALSDNVANPEFGFYEIFTWRGSFNCRHQWVRLIYKKDGDIRNTASSTKGLEREEGLGPTLQPNTVPLNQRDKIPPRVGSTFASQDEFIDTISDYPKGVSEAAQRALDYANKNGWGSCGTGVGKQRANQLAKGENISLDTVKRMYSYLSRHKGDLTTSKSYDDGCGKLMYDAWGGEAGLRWAERKLSIIEKSASNRELSIDDMMGWGGKNFDSKKLLFYDDDKRILVGAAMVPNKMIHRYDDLGNMYYVYFSKDSIKKMAEKFLRQKRTDETSIEHNGVKLGSEKVYITESWVSEDPIKDKSAAFGFELPAGTWFVSMKVEDPKIWKMIKQKALTGFSVEGLFAEKSVFSKETKKINQIKQILKSIEDDK